MQTQFMPGQEVRLVDGTRGVLFAKTHSRRRQPSTSDAPQWYFLPDGAAAVGLVVLRQPREISEAAIAEGLGMRAGVWPSPRFELHAWDRPAVYAAHMRGAALPRFE